MIDSLLGDNLVAAAVQAGVLVVAAAPLPRLLGVWSPRARLAYWRLVMVACLALPLLQPRVQVAVPSLEPAASSAAVLARTDDGVGERAAAATAVTLPPIRAGDVIVAGAALRLAWLALGLVVLSRLRRRAAPLWPRTRALDEAVEATGTDADFLVSARALRPMTFGFVRPVVLVPSDFTRFPHEQQRAIACHELVHVRRFDWLRAAGDEVIRSLAWFHPAAWWLTSQIHLSREQLVDEQVVRRLGGRRQYLEALLQLASTDRRGGLLPASLFLGRAHLPQRVALLVKEVRMSRPRLVLSFVTMAFVLALCGAAVVAAFPLHSAAEAVLDAGAQPPAQGPRRIHDVRPALPAGAGAEGAMPWFLELTLDERGHVAGVRLLAGGSNPLGDAVVAAVRQWRYTPPPRAPHTLLVGFNLAAGRQDPSQPPVLVGGDVRPPVKILDVRPVYPNDALDAGVEGVVVLEARIDAEGAVSEAQVIRSVPPLDRAALDAVLRWRYIAAGFPVQMTMTINFTLSEPAAPTPPPPPPAAGGVTGGVPGGVAGGIRGGVSGGVGRGATGGVPGGYVRAGEDADPPKKVVDVRPVYPADALAAGLEGVVVLEATIGPDGKVQEARVVRSVPAFDQAALDAVRQWQFEPTVIHRKPVGVVMTVTVNFTLQ